MLNTNKGLGDYYLSFTSGGGKLTLAPPDPYVYAFRAPLRAGELIR